LLIRLGAEPLYALLLQSLRVYPVHEPPVLLSHIIQHRHDKLRFRKASPRRLGLRHPEADDLPGPTLDIVDAERKLADLLRSASA